ncbi:hypothetical protein NDU88_006552 [Pleurodeles waltl]|uniref:Uncharacterized protein n=1 Tax=Pleurodeles waltl TaxID=8319 RepID=A0AAV7QNW9_PLEWA|nr:hypothetical protein NDU88_006551 [Pleurodeles waltl]KAJ1140194.1 hypothetical protein NDU88_006552 [Pleurodeles waltl]
MPTTAYFSAAAPNSIKMASAPHATGYETPAGTNGLSLSGPKAPHAFLLWVSPVPSPTRGSSSQTARALLLLPTPSSVQAPCGTQYSYLQYRMNVLGAYGHLMESLYLTADYWLNWAPV